MGKLGVGKRGSDLEIALPVGTTIREISTTSKTNNSFHVPVRYRFLTMDGKILYCIGNRRFCDMALKRNFNIISYYRITDRWKTQLINLICSRDNNQQTLFFSQKAIKYEVQNTHERLKVAQGGIGGTGSFRFRSSELKGAIIAEKGAFPTSKVFEFELKATAEVVIVGFNDAGKFSILSSLITHDFSISAYPYPDVMPKVGAIWFGDIPKVFIADIPSAFLTENINTDEVKYLLPYISRASLILYFAGIKSNNSLREFQRFLYRVNRGGQNGRAKPEIVLIGEITPYGSYSGEISRLARYAKKGGFTFVPASIRPFKDSYPIKGLIKKIVTSAREKEKMAIGM